MSDPIRSFVIKGNRINVSAEKGDRVLEQFPDAQEVIDFDVKGNTISVPKAKVDMFAMKFKDATPLPGYDWQATTVKDNAPTPTPEVSVNPESQASFTPPTETESQVQPTQEIATPTISQAPKYEIDGKEFANKDEFLKEVETYKGKPVTHNIKVSNDQETDNRVKAITLEDEFYNKKIEEGDPSFAVSTYALEKHQRENYNKISDQAKASDEKIISEVKVKYEAETAKLEQSFLPAKQAWKDKSKDIDRRAKEIDTKLSKAASAVDRYDKKSVDAFNELRESSLAEIAQLEKEGKAVDAEYSAKGNEFNSKQKELAAKADTDIEASMTKERKALSSSLGQSEYFDKEDETAITKALEHAPKDYLGKKAYIQELVDTYSAGFEPEQVTQVKKDLYAMITPKVLFDDKGEPTAYIFKNQADTQLQRLIQHKAELTQRIDSAIREKHPELSGFLVDLAKGAYALRGYLQGNRNNVNSSEKLTSSSNELMNDVNRMAYTEEAIAEYQKALASPESSGSVKAGGFWRNFTGETAINVASAGFYGADKAVQVAALAQKGEHIAPEQKETLNAIMLKNAIEGKMQDNYSMAQIVGKGLTESLPFMTSMAMSAGTAGIVSAATKKALKWQLMKTSLTSMAGVSNFAKGAASIMASAAVRVPMSGMYYEGLQKRRVDIQAKFEGNKFGTETKTSDKSLAWDAARQFVSTYPDFLTEGMEPAIAKYITAPIAKKLGLGYLTDAGKGQISKWVGKAAHATNMHDLPTEILSEELSSVMNVATGDQSVDDFLKLKTHIALVLTIAAMSTPMSVLKAATSTPNIEGIEAILDHSQVVELDKITAIEDINEKAKKLTAFSYKNNLTDDQVMEVATYAWDKQQEQVQQITSEVPAEPVADQPVTEVEKPTEEAPATVSEPIAPIAEEEVKKPSTEPIETASEPMTQAEGITKTFADMGEGVKKASLLQVIDQFGKGEVVFKNKEAIAAAQANENYNTEVLPDGSLKITGIKNPDTNKWVGEEPVRDSQIAKEDKPKEKETNKSAATQGFFSDVVSGADKKFVPVRPWKAILPFTATQKAFKKTYDRFNGNFDTHIATSIPAFREVQVKVGNAIVKMFGGKKTVMYDIGGSEGGFVKAITSASKGNISTVNVDANTDMKKAHETNSVVGSTFEQGAFHESFTNDNGEVVPLHTPSQKADVVHESMTFQFISSDRGAFVDTVADNYLKEDGLFITEEKLMPNSEEQYLANENKKDSDYKPRFYDAEQITAKAETILTGMKKKQASLSDYIGVLKKRFKYVEQYWDSGNFKGIVASNDKAKVNAFLKEVGNTDTEFSEKNIKQANEQVATHDLSEEELRTLSPKGLRDVYTAGRKIFGLNKAQSLAQAIIVDRMVAKMAKNKGISKLKAYEGIEFKKVDKAVSDQITSKQVQGNKGAMMMEDGKAIVMALTNPDVSTPLHEIAHVYERYMTEAERKSVLAWTGHKAWNTDTSEKFARGFERYLSDGISPNKVLGAVFKRLKEWITDIYNGIKGSAIDLTLSPNMKNLYDSILTGKKYIPIEEKVKTDAVSDTVNEPVSDAVKKTTTEELDDLFGGLSFQSADVLFQASEDQITKALNQAIDIAEAHVEKDVPKAVRDAIKRSGKTISEDLVNKVLDSRGYKQTVNKDLKGMVDTAMNERMQAAVEQGIRTQAEYEKFISAGFGSYVPISQADSQAMADVMFTSLGSSPDERIDNALQLVKKEKMNPDVAIALLVRASAEAETLQSKAKNDATVQYYVDKNIEILGVAESEGTNYGRGVSYFNSEAVKQYWGYREYLRDTERLTKEAQDNFFAKNIQGKVENGKFIPELDKNGDLILKGDLKKLSDALDTKKMVKEAKPVVTSSPKYKEVRDKATKAPTKEKIIKDETKALYAKWKALEQTQRSGILFQGEEVSAKELLSKIIGNYILLGVYKTEDIIAKVKAEVKANIGLNISDEVILSAIPTEVGGKPFEEWQKGEEDAKAAEVLAQRLKALSSEKKPDNDPLHIMIRTLVSKASEKMSQGEKKGKSDLEIIAIAIKNRDAWMDVWDNAKSLAFEKIDNSKVDDDMKLSMKAKIEEAYRLATKSPFSEALLDRTIKETAEELGIRIDRIVHSSITERTLIKGELQQALVDKAGLSGTDAKALEDAVSEALDNFISVKSAKEVDKYITKQDKLKPIPLGKIIQLLKEETAKFKRKFPTEGNPFDYMRSEIRRLAKEKLQSDPITQSLYTDAKIDKMTDLNLAAAAFISPVEVQDLANHLSSDMRAKIANEDFLKDFPSEEKAKIEFMATSLQSESISRTSQDEEIIIRSRAVSEMIGMVRAGAFENENFLRAFAIGKGIAPPTPAQVTEVKRLHDVMKKEKSEIIKKERELELTAYISNFTKPDIASIIQVSVITGMLAGVGTMVYNGFVGFVAAQSMRAMQSASSIAHLDMNRLALVHSAWSKALMPSVRRAAGVLQSGFAHETSVLDVPTMIERARTDSKVLNFLIAHAKYVIRAMTAPDGANVGILEEGLLQLRMYDESHKDWRSTGARSKKEWIKNFLYADLGITPQSKEDLRLELENFINDAAADGRYYTKRQQLLLQREMIDRHRAEVNINARKWQHQAHRNATWFTGNAEYMGTIGNVLRVMSDTLKSAVNGFAPGVKVAMLPVTAITLFLRIMSVVAEVSLNANPVIGWLRLKRGGYGTLLSSKNKNFVAIDEYDRDIIKKQMKFGAGVFAATAAILLSGAGGDDDDPWFTVTGGGGGLLFPDPIAGAQRSKTHNYQAFSLKFGAVHVPYLSIPGVTAALIPLGNLMDQWRFGTSKVTEVIDGKPETKEVLNRIRYKDEKNDWFAKRLIAAWVAVPLFVTTQSTMPVAKDFSDLLVGSSVKALTKTESFDLDMNDVMIAAMKYSNVKNAIAPAYIRDIYGSWAFLTNQAMDDGDNLQKVLVQNTLLQWAFMDKDTPQINVWGKELIVHDTPLNKRIFSYRETDPVIANHNKWDKDPNFSSMKTKFYIPGEDVYVSRPLDMAKHDEWKAFYEFTKERGNLLYDAASRNMGKVDQEYRDAMDIEEKEATEQAKARIQERISFGDLHIEPNVK